MMQYKLDVITIVSSDTPKDWVETCINSVEEAGQMVINNHIVSDGVEGHIGIAKRNSLKQSNADYVCWVDDDDYVLPNAFSCVTPHLKNQPAAIFTREIHLLCNGKSVHIDRRHHLAVFRRDVLDEMPLEEWPLPTAHMIPFVESHEAPCIDEMSWVYVYRRYISKAMKLRAKLQTNSTRPE
jgi:hypothetical protein